jgi:uncharacterized protein HemX
MAILVLLAAALGAGIANFARTQAKQNQSAQTRIYHLVAEKTAFANGTAEKD